MSTPLINRRRLMMQMAGGGGGEHPLPSWCIPVDYIEGVNTRRLVPPNEYPTYPPILSGKLTYYKARWTSGWIAFVVSGCFSLVYSGYNNSRNETYLKFLFNGTQWGDIITLPYNLRSETKGTYIQDVEYDGTYVYVKGYRVENDSLILVTDQTILFPSAPTVVNTYISVYGGQDPGYQSGTVYNNSLRYYDLEIRTENGGFKFIPCNIPFSGGIREAFFDSIGNVVWRFSQDSVVPTTSPSQL